MNAGAISVVLIVKDGERFLREAIDSVQRQTLAPCELIAVDDGSRDGTARILEDARRRAPDLVQVLRHPGGANRGMSRSRNLGLSRATGEFVTFLDHDDAMLPDKLASMKAGLHASPTAAGVVGPCRRWGSWNGGDDRDQAMGIADGTVLEPPGPLADFTRDSSLVPLAPLLRTKVVREIGGYVETFSGMHEDQAFLARLLLRHPVAYTDRVLHLYRQHDDSCVARTHRTGRDRLARRLYLRWLAEEVRRAGRAPDGLSDVIERELASTRGWALRWFRRSLINLRRPNRPSPPRD